jgi:predicted nucleotidyltransferase
MKQANSINLKQLRKDRGFTQEQLGIIAGMTKSQVSKMERGLLGSEATISRVLAALGYSTQIIYIDSRGKLTSERDRILDILRVFKINNADKYGIESLALFGSVARNEQIATSDVDILISLKTPSLYLYAGLKNDLESILCREVDIISAKSKLRAEFMNSIKEDLIYV